MEENQFQRKKKGGGRRDGKTHLLEVLVPLEKQDVYGALVGNSGVAFKLLTDLCTNRVGRDVEGVKLGDFRGCFRPCGKRWMALGR